MNDELQKELAGLAGRQALGIKHPWHRVKDIGETPLEAIAHFQQRNKLGLGRYAKVHMVGDLTLGEACSRAGVKYSSVYWRLTNCNESAEQAFSHFV